MIITASPSVEAKSRQMVEIFETTKPERKTAIASGIASEITGTSKERRFFHLPTQERADRFKRSPEIRRKRLAENKELLASVSDFPRKKCTDSDLEYEVEAVLARSLLKTTKATPRTSAPITPTHFDLKNSRWRLFGGLNGPWQDFIFPCVLCRWATSVCAMWWRWEVQKSRGWLTSFNKSACRTWHMPKYLQTRLD